VRFENILPSLEAGATGLLPKTFGGDFFYFVGTDFKKNSSGSVTDFTDLYQYVDTTEWQIWNPVTNPSLTLSYSQQVSAWNYVVAPTRGGLTAPYDPLFLEFTRYLGY